MAEATLEVTIRGQDKSKRAFGSVTKSLQSIGKVAVGAAAAGLAAVGAAAVGAGIAAVKTSLDFQDATSAIIAGTGASGETLAEMEQIAKNLKGTSAGLGSEFGDLGAVIAEVNTRTGATGESLENLSADILQMSRLSGTDAVENVGLLTRVMGDWGVEMEDSAALTDTLFGASQAFGIGVDEISRKVVQFGAPLRQMGFTLEESVALFGKWEKEGVNAELAIGSLRIAAGKFARENIPLKEGLQDTMDAIKGATDESEALALGMEVFGARAGPDMTAAIREGRFELEGAIEALRGTEGGLADAAARSLTFGERFTIMKDQVLVALMPLGDLVLNFAEGIMPKMQNIIQNGVMPAVKDLTGFIKGFVSALQSGQDPVNAAIDAFLTWTNVGENLSDEMFGLVLRIGEIWEQIKAGLAPIIQAIGNFVQWQDVLLALGVAIAAVVVPAVLSIVAAIAPVIAVFAAVTAAVALVRTAWEENWGGIQEKTEAVIDFIVPLVNDAITSIQDFWRENGDEILAKARNVWRKVQQAIKSAVDFIWNDVIQPTVASITAFWASHGDEILAKAETVWNGIQGAIQFVVDQISTIVEAWQAAFEGDWERFGELLREHWDRAWDAIVSLLDGLWRIIEPILQDLIDGAINKFQTTDWGEVGRAIIDGLVAGIKGGVKAVEDAARAVAQAAVDAALGFLGVDSPSKVFREIGVNIGAGLIDGILSTTSDVEAAITGLFEVAGKLGSIGGAIARIFKRREVDPLQAHLEGMTEVAEGLSEQIAETLQVDPAWFATLTVLEKTILRNQAIAAGQTQLANNLKDLIELDEMRAAATTELAQKQEKLLAIQKQQEDLAILQAQQDLLNLIRENNLSTSILDGLEIGIGADLGAILEATSSAMQRIIFQAQQDLGISSPSKVFREIGNNVIDTLANTLEGGRRQVGDAMRTVLPDPRRIDPTPGPALATATPAQGVRDVTINIHPGGESVLSQVRQALAEAGLRADQIRRVR